MSEKLVYADLNLTESTRPKLQKVIDVQDSTYAEVKVQSLDRSAAVSYTSSGKSCCSRTCVAVLVAVTILLLVLALCLILMYKLSADHPTTSRPADSKTFPTICEDAHEPGLELATENGMDPRGYGENQKKNHEGCPKHWEKNGGKCYFFSQRQAKTNWNDSRKECIDMKADLVIIDNKDELKFLYERSRSSYYLLGLTFSHSEKKWKWINNMELSSDMFCIGGYFADYFCTVIGHGKVETAHCSGSLSTQNMCEKAADITESQKES